LNREVWTMSDDEIPSEWKRRSPLMTPRAWRHLKGIIEHEDAPRWNYEVGDRVVASDLDALEVYRERVESRLGAQTGALPSERMLAWVRERREHTPLFRQRIPEGLDLAMRWHEIKPSTREDISATLELCVPLDEPLDRVLTYDTSGTTGHALILAHHPRALALNHALLEFVMRRWGRPLVPGPDQIIGVNLCAQERTYIFANTFSAWGQAAFVKANLRDADWATGREGARRFLEQARPQFITGDPVTFAELLEFGRGWGLGPSSAIVPRVWISTATALSASLSAQLTAITGAPVIDWYSMTEAGPIAYSAPGVEGLHILPPDLHVELLDEDGFAVGPGERGEVTLTGGRNPYLPLLRYRTGDYARMVYEPSAVDTTPRLLDLEGRAYVSFRGDGGRHVNSLDIGRMIRKLAVFSQHQFVQEASGECELVIRPAPLIPVDVELLRMSLQELFGPQTPIVVRLDARLGDDSPGGKVLPFVRR
jgi:phenylacetate-CoA ligase